MRPTFDKHERAIAGRLHRIEDRVRSYRVIPGFYRDDLRRIAQARLARVLQAFVRSHYKYRLFALENRQRGVEVAGRCYEYCERFTFFAQRLPECSVPFREGRADIRGGEWVAVALAQSPRPLHHGIGCSP